MKVIFELSILIFVVFTLVTLKLPLESSDAIIWPFSGLILLRLWYLVNKGEIKFRTDIFNFQNNKKAIVYYGVATFLVVFTLWLLKSVLVLPLWLRDVTDMGLWFMVLHALFQEIIFRSYLVNRTKLIIKNSLSVALISGAIFAGAHLILPNAGGILLPLLILGIMWSYLYQKFPNLLYVWVSHLMVVWSINFLYPL